MYGNWSGFLETYYVMYVLMTALMLLTSTVLIFIQHHKESLSVFPLADF